MNAVVPRIPDESGHYEPKEANFVGHTARPEDRVEKLGGYRAGQGSL